MIDQIDAIKVRMWKQYLVTAFAKTVFVVFLWLIISRSSDGAGLAILVVFFLVGTDLTVVLHKSLKSIDENAKNFGEKFIRDALDLLDRKGDSSVYHQLLMTTYDGEQFAK